MSQPVTATLKQSNKTTVVSSILNPITLSSLQRAGLATSTDGTHTVSSLTNATADARIAAATAQNPISLGLDIIRQVPAFYPEKF
jgi:hypothetical protein